eukprot:9865502-Ditylum_brightwellii.AAC.1
MVNVAMLSFMDLFGAKESHGLSPFSRIFDPVNELVEAVKDFFSSKLSMDNDNASATDSDNDEDSDANEADNEINDDNHRTNIPEKRIKHVVSSLQNT